MLHKLKKARYELQLLVRKIKKKNNVKTKKILTAHHHLAHLASSISSYLFP